MCVCVCVTWCLSLTATTQPVCCAQLPELNQRWFASVVRATVLKLDKKKSFDPKAVVRYWVEVYVGRRKWT